MKNTDPDRVPNCENFAINCINLEYKKIQQNLAIFFLQYSNNGNG